MIHHILHPVDLGLIYALHLVQVVDTQVANGIRRVAVQINQCLEAVLLAAVKQPVDRTLAGTGDRVCLAVIPEEVVQEVVADNLPAGAALIAKGFCDIIEVFFQRICTINRFQPCTQARNDIIVQIIFIGDRNDIVYIWLIGKPCCRFPIVGIVELWIMVLCQRNTSIPTLNWAIIFIQCSLSLVFPIDRIKVSTCKNKTGFIQRVAAKHTAHRIAEQALDITLQVSLAHSHIFIFHFWGQLVLQAVNVNKNAVQLFFVGFQLVKTVIAFCIPLVKGFRYRGNIAEQWVLLKIPRGFKGIPIRFCYSNSIV